MARLLYFDCFSGASGDMILGALLDLGLPLEGLKEAVDSLGLEGVKIERARVDRSGVGATNVHVLNDESFKDHASHQHESGQPHHHHHHRNLSAINKIIDGSGLTSSVKDRSKHLFRRLAEAEADVHQQSVEEIHFHEVGAVDSIVDVVGAVFGLEWIGVDRVVASAVNVGSGRVKCAHGVFPVPAPATTYLLSDVEVYATSVDAELLTPTGALIISDYADSYGLMPQLKIRQVGYGAGDLDIPDSPNVLRLILGDEGQGNVLQRVVVIDTEIDDMNPQLYGVVMDQLYAAGALDVFFTPVQMKKNRPGILVSIVGLPEDRVALSSILFRETSTIGLRFKEMDRECLVREQVIVQTKLGAVQFKLARYENTIVNVCPEFDDCVRLATKHAISVKEVQAVAMKAYLDE